jgi:hypothetical protein
VKPEQASKVKMRTPTLLFDGDGRAVREETDEHRTGSPGQWARHVRKAI